MKRRIISIADLLNPLPEEKEKKPNVIIHHSFNEVLRQLREEQPKIKKKKPRQLNKKVQPAKKQRKKIQPKDKLQKI